MPQLICRKCNKLKSEDKKTENHKYCVDCGTAYSVIEDAKPDERRLVERFGFFIPIIVVGIPFIVIFSFGLFSGRGTSRGDEVIDGFNSSHIGSQLVDSESTELKTKPCDPWMISAESGACLSTDEWCHKKIGKHSIGKKTLDVDPSIRSNPTSSCLCEDGYHFNYIKNGCIKTCNEGECANDNRCEEIPLHSSCNTDSFMHETGDGWHCNNGYVKKEEQCANKVEVALYCMDKYGVHSKLDESGECVCSYGYHLAPAWLNGPIRCVIDGSNTSERFPSVSSPSEYIPAKPIPIIESKPYIPPTITIPKLEKQPSGSTCTTKENALGEIITDCSTKWTY